MNKVISFIQKLGPGLLFAGAAIGVSHLVQSTRAGAGYGFALLWAVILVLLAKYPFFEYGTRYTAAKGETLLSGYKRIGQWLLWIYVLLTPLTMFTIQAAVTVVSAGLFISVFGLSISIQWVSLILLLVCLVILMVGRYSTLDNLIKVIVILLTVCTFIAVIFAFGKSSEPISFTPIVPLEGAGLVFLIALMGWMPAPVDMSVWNSIWAEAKQKSTKEDFDYKSSLLDFNVGYWTTLVIAIFFLSLGALVMYNSGTDFSPKGAVFAGQLISLYTETLGDWSYWLISIAAIATMFSTTLTCLDALPRVMGRATVLLGTALPQIDHKGTVTTLDDIRSSDFDEVSFNSKDRKAYWIWMAILILGTLIILNFLMSSMTTLITIATVASFLTTPFYAIANYVLITGKHTPQFAHPGMKMRLLSWFGLIFLTGFSVLYLVSLV